MNKKLIYIYKFLYKSSKGRYSLVPFFPFLSITMGSLIILLVLGTMQSMENTIFKAIRVADFTYQGELIDDMDYNDKTHSYIGNSRQYVVFNNDSPILMKITSLNKFDNFKRQHINDYLVEKDETENIGPEIIVGEAFAARLGLSVSDSIVVLSPLDFDIMTSYIPKTTVYISGIFSYNGELPLAYESNYAFMTSEYPVDILKSSSNNKIFISSGIEASDENIKKFNLEHWSKKHTQLASALKLEKLIYSSFGYFIIIVAALSSGALTFLFIIKKAKQLALFRVLGLSKKSIAITFMLNSVSNSALGVSFGTAIYFLISLLDSKYLWVRNTFFPSFPEFYLNFNIEDYLFIVLISIIFIIISTLYPIFKVGNSSIANTLGGKL